MSIGRAPEEILLVSKIAVFSLPIRLCLVGNAVNGKLHILEHGDIGHTPDDILLAVLDNDLLTADVGVYTSTAALGSWDRDIGVIKLLTKVFGEGNGYVLEGLTLKVYAGKTVDGDLLGEVAGVAEIPVGDIAGNSEEVEYPRRIKLDLTVLEHDLTLPGGAVVLTETKAVFVVAANEGNVFKIDKTFTDKVKGSYLGVGNDYVIASAVSIEQRDLTVIKTTVFTVVMNTTIRYICLSVFQAITTMSLRQNSKGNIRLFRT